MAVQVQQLLPERFHGTSGVGVLPWGALKVRRVRRAKKRYIRKPALTEIQVGVAIGIRPMSQVPLGLLQQFVRVARVGNLSRAATQANLTVSALSHQMRQLEERL